MRHQFLKAVSYFMNPEDLDKKWITFISLILTVLSTISSRHPKEKLSSALPKVSIGHGFPGYEPLLWLPKKRETN